MISGIIPFGKNLSLNIPRRYNVLVAITNEISVDEWLPYNLPVKQPDLRQMNQFWGHCCIYFLSQAETHSYAEREEAIDKCESALTHRADERDVVLLEVLSET